jgi:hypothetical protein
MGHAKHSAVVWRYDGGAYKLPAISFGSPIKTHVYGARRSNSQPMGQQGVFLGHRNAKLHGPHP